MPITYLDEKPRITYLDEKKPLGKVTFGPTALPGFLETEKKIAERKTIAEPLMEELKAPPPSFRERPVKTAISTALGLPGLARGAKAIGLGFERGEAALAGPALAMQRGEFRPRELGREFVKGIKGERLAEFGDIGRAVGWPEMLSSTAGLFALGGVTDAVTQGQLVKSVNKAKSFLGSKIPRVMSNKYLLNKAKLASSGIDDLYTGLSKQYDDIYNKVGNVQVLGDDLTRVQTIIDDLPTTLINKIKKSKLVAKTTTGEIIPDLNNLKAIRGLIRKAVPDKVWQGKAIGDMNTAQVERAYGEMGDIMAKTEPTLRKLNTSYRKFRNMQKTVNNVLYDQNGNIVANKLKQLFSRGGEPGRREVFERFTKMWPQAQQVMKDFISHNRRQTMGRFLGRAALVGGGYHLVRRGLGGIFGEGGGGGGGWEQ